MNPTYSYLLHSDPELDLSFERQVDLPLDALWQGWTDPTEIIHWFTPTPWQTTACRIDLRPGGEFYTQMKSPEGQIIDNFGCFLFIVPKSLLVFTDTMLSGFRPSGNDFTTIFLSFESNTHNITSYKALVKHKNVENKTKHEEMGFHKGWGIALDQLVARQKSKT